VLEILSDNLYSRWRRTCTSHVHGVVHRQYLHRALGALGQSIIKIINRSTHFINELLYMHFVTDIPGPLNLRDTSRAPPVGFASACPACAATIHPRTPGVAGRLAWPQFTHAPRWLIVRITFTVSSVSLAALEQIQPLDPRWLIH
jgi:hypothetical protein